MTRTELAKQINWEGTATREIQINSIPFYKIGEIINPGLCWTDGGEFKVESKGKYSVIFVITENVEGHKVDYENEEETESIGATDCEHEEEIIINKDFEIVDFWEWDEETRFAKVFLKAI